MYSEAPLLSISGSAPLSELGQGAMQEIDQIGMAKPVTKSAAMVTDGRHIPGMIAEALRLAYSGRRGPVHLTVPIDIQEREVLLDEVPFLSLTSTGPMWRRLPQTSRSVRPSRS